MSKILIGVAIIVLAGAGWFAFSGQDTKNDVMMKKESVMTGASNEVMAKKEADTAMMQKDIIVALGALNASGQTGTATLSDMNGKTKVVVEISGSITGVPQPSHIHMGSCSSVGAVTYPLSAVIDGKAETVLDVSLATLGSKLPLAVMVHKSKEEVKTFVSCGDLSKEGFPAMMPQN